MKRLAAFIVFVVAANVLSGSAAAPVTPLVGTLRSGSAVFWHGARVGSTSDRVADANATAADCTPEPCFQYMLKIVEKAARLRVAIDVPQRNDLYELTVTSPSGEATTVENLNAFNAEAFVIKPAVGVWTVTVTPIDAEYSTFDLRAKLEKTPYEPSKKKALWLPNLIVPRLWEFGFIAPVTGLAGISFDDANPAVDVAGIHPFSCTLDEMEAGAHRCLRFSFQLASAGDGYFDVRFDTSSNPLAGAMIQCIQRPGKPPVAHPAGDFTFHAAHAHYHYEDVVEHQLWHVTDLRKGKMVLVGGGEKTGYHPADQSFAKWDEFVQAASNTYGADGNCYPGSNDEIGLSMGWGDAYRWQRPGNFVEFGSNPDGYYVVRTIADPLNHVMETSDADNVGYAFLRIVGDSIRLLEQGMGKSPWDKHKVVNRH